ncbi:MAG TPA: diaminopimelate epimerase [Candidatus Baltobacteraceae bacterium]|nr:diaminopimelate epimerase [Candidatus Baltobacteraceae bacterium]
MSSVAVTKMHGTFNDFIVLDRRSSEVADLHAFARDACDRRGGVGADGVIVIEPSDRADVRMRIINADGSEAEMCGNGARCAARFLSDRGEGTHFRFETLAGLIVADVLDNGNVRLNVGVPHFEQRALPFADADFVWVGNPHVVIFAASLDEVDVEAIGASNPDVNVHAAVVTGEHTMRVRHYERGAGLTYSCGTGSVACAAAAIRRGLTKSPVDVRVPGGHVLVEWDGSQEAFLTGPAVRVFDATVDGAHAAPL